MTATTLRAGLRAAARRPFARRLAAPLCFGLRIYLGSVWLSYGMMKIRAGWLTTNPMPEILGLVARGLTPSPLPAYRQLAELLLALHLDRVLGVAIPVAELAFASAFFMGVLLVPVAIAACLLNLNLILSGIATTGFDGRLIALQLLLLLAWRVAGPLGIGESLARLLRSYRALGVRGGPQGA